MLVLGVDVGGTATRAVVVDGDGNCLGLGRAGRGNPTAVGVEAAAEAITSAASEAAARAGVALVDLRSGIAAVAGAGRGGAELLGALRAAGLPGDLALRPDLLAMFRSGTISSSGYAVIVGTGAIAGRVRAGELERTSDGIGWLLGDVGSGYWIGRRVLRRVAAALDGRGAATSMTEAVLAVVAATDQRRAVPSMRSEPVGRDDALSALVAVAYELDPGDVAQFAPVAFEAAAAGDPVAVAVVEAAAEGLARTLGVVLSDDVSGPLVYGGSVAVRQEPIGSRLASTFRAHAPADGTCAVTDGSVGAAALALEHAGVVVDDEVFARLVHTVAPR